MLENLQTLLPDLQSYVGMKGPERTAHFSQICQKIAVLNHPVSIVDEKSALLEQQILQEMLLVSATLEPVWGLIIGLRLWISGKQLPNDFINTWNCSRYAGIHSRFSGLSPQQHLENLDTLYGAKQVPIHSPAQFIIRGNALRQLHRYSEAESSYIEGLVRCCDNPFLQLRLVDLWLMTYQHARAVPLLDRLRSRYPYVLEHMFAIHVPDDIACANNIFTDLDGGVADLVWFVAADPVYIQRFGFRLAQGVAKLLENPLSPRIKLHLHMIVDDAATLPMQVLQGMASLISLHVTQRQVHLQGATTNQRKAVFASERFLFLHELLEKYNKPLLVTDIDVDPLQHPFRLFKYMGDGDVGYTRFGVVRDAWDLYPATALTFQPTSAAITFCKRLSGMIITLLAKHPDPWFVDQVALYRLIEGGLTPAKFSYLENILNDADSPNAFFRILHGSWQH